ncbi:hypothetical protein LOC68_01695 [Blastopirellula sp. JC732]|uniref:Uncharacterized protein n=1 Tax=Blastopirellula sediminis TaxID=2894196 RepID=A0A9X1MHB8_9BACT|nr:hypothetical protein [Blastopirellula sediminis]MCC9608099.1 hypothetical protein [Blastopirellula sediminis]MCC9627108.1 hypothetical protein [Blastopirellula sediminis]
MSWKVDGVYYHDWAEYQQALRLRDQRLVRAHLDTLQRDFSRQQEAIRRTEQELRQANNNYQRQVQLNAQLAEQIAEQEGTLRVLGNAQQAMAREVEEEFSRVRDCLTSTQRDVAELDQFVQQEKEEVQRQFGELESDLVAGLAEARESQNQLEAELRKSIREVDDKLDAEIQSRIAKDQDQLAQANVFIEFIEEMFAGLQKQAHQIGETPALDRLQLDLASARRMVQEGAASAAYATAQAALSEAKTAQHAFTRKATEIQCLRQSTEARIARLRKAISDPLVSKYFAVEAAKVQRFLQDLDADLVRSFQRAATLEVDRSYFDRQLESIDAGVAKMVALTPMADSEYQTRDDHILEMIRELRQPSALGTLLSAPKDELADPNDPKSAKIVTLEFQSGRVQITFPLDRTEGFSMDGFGHSSDRECGQAFLPVQRFLQRFPMTRSACGAARRIPTVSGGYLQNRLNSIRRDLRHLQD